MSNGLGYAAGEGAGAFKSALYPTLHYKIAMAQQQMETGMQAEKLRMDQESAVLENEKTRLATEQAKFALETSKYNLEQTKQIEKDIDTAAETMAPKPSVAGTGVKAIKAGKKVSLPGIERLGKERAGQRAMTRIGLRKAPGQVLFPEEPTEKIIGSATTGVLKYTKEGGMETLLAPPAKQLGSLKTSDIKNVYSIASQGYTKAEWEDLDPVEAVRAANAVGRDTVDGWVDQTVPYEVKFKNVSWGKDKMKTVRGTPEQIDIIREAEKDRDNQEITQADFEELLEDVLAEE